MVFFFVVAKPVLILGCARRALDDMQPRLSGTIVSNIGVLTGLTDLCDESKLPPPPFRSDFPTSHLADS